MTHREAVYLIPNLFDICERKQDVTLYGLKIKYIDKLDHYRFIISVEKMFYKITFNDTQEYPISMENVIPKIIWEVI